MKKNAFEKLKGYFLAFLITALAFLAVGLGTLGSVYGAGNAYELRAKQATDAETPSVVFRLSNLTEKDASGSTSTVSLRLTSIYVNIAAIYGDPGTPTSLRVERSTGGTTFSNALTATVENFYTVTEADGDGKTPEAPDAADAFFRFVAPFDLSSGWRVSTYPYLRLSVNGTSPNVLVNEVVFVGEKLDSNYESTGETCVIPAVIYEATPFADERASEAFEHAKALLDAQTDPRIARSTFDRFSSAEIYSMLTISEMRQGNRYVADKAGVPLDTYTIDGVYGALGEDILALGTLMFGMSPFGLRFFPMLAAFGVLVVLSRLTVRLTHSEKTGFLFALFYALSCLTLAYGHLGTPLMIGIFFFVCALDAVHRFYAKGIGRANFLGVLPLLAGGLAGGAAICVNGAFLIPLTGVVALFIAGMVRQQRAKKYRLGKIAEGDFEPEDEEDTPERAAGRMVLEYRFKNTAAPVLFFAGLVFGAFLFALLGMLPAYFAYLRAYDNPANPVFNVFMLSWQAFANGFTGVNPYAVYGPWDPFAVLWRGEGSLQAVTMASMSPAVIFACALGLIGLICAFIAALRAKEKGKEQRADFRCFAVTAVGMVLSLLAALVKTAAPFVVLFYLFAMAAAACGANSAEKKAPAAVKVLTVISVVLAALVFAALAVFTFSVPLAANFVRAIFG